MPYFAGAFTVLPIAEIWLIPALELSGKTGHAVAMSVALLAGFLTRALFKRLHDPPEPSLPSDRDRAV